ncbi:glycoside hydrolase family 35 protein [Amycolatopsis sp. H20-H5]|uniref:glycoside hydrolase family 35 protein n=1 Tax=Amycolatopsis sp. H20-H5 TaxID=3046309 RepID=UPI002DBED5DD|nr:beta-galactosidase [Amycolatopsis sp. H20-H5]MEC3974991.1 beta-galactosidase [Amycolatopsis sp. H20-H5]
MAGQVSLGTQHIQIDGTPTRILSGSINYFRIVPEQWRSRLRWARYLGLNTIETYVPWNLHEPYPGETTFQGLLDLVSFLDTAQEEGLHVILRPGPYVCAELDFGGLPAWLLAESGLRLRTSDPAYLAWVEAWFEQLIPRVADLQHDRGGPIIAMQVENEFGAAAKDRGAGDSQYLTWLVERLRGHGVTVPLLTCDQDDATMVALGGLPGLWPTMNFGSNPDSAWSTLAAHRPGTPKMCMEFWNGWFDHWGEERHTRDPQDAAAVLEQMLAGGASVNLYMFCGGTNFGFTNGANHFEHYQPTITSYDYDAPLSEHGVPTKKFEAYREVLARYTTLPAVEPPAPAPLLPERTVLLTRMIPLLDALPALSAPLTAAAPLTMERLGQNFGFTAYAFDVPQAGAYTLSIPGVRDRAQIIVDGVERGVLERESAETTMQLHVDRPATTVTVLVENLGRVNYGPELADAKGILGDILLDDVPVGEVTMYPLPLDTVDALDFTAAAETVPRTAGPVFCQGEFTVDEPGDTFVALPGFGKGLVWVNGFNLGRYWDRGPQRTLYLPGPVLRPGNNTLVILELHHLPLPRVQLTTIPDLG